jgi:hypothetical protein
VNILFKWWCVCYSSNMICNYYCDVLGFEIERYHASWFAILIKLSVTIWGIL